MPYAYQGAAANLRTAVKWSAGLAAFAGTTYVQPSNGIPLLFIATTSGTTANLEPAWGAAPFAVPGSVFTDGGGVSWMCLGSYQMAGVAPILFPPVDTDPPGAASVAGPLQTLADYIANLQANAAQKSAFAFTSGAFGAPPVLSVAVSNALPAPTLYTGGTYPTSKVRWDQLPDGRIRMIIAAWLQYAIPSPGPLALADAYLIASLSLDATQFNTIDFVRAHAGLLVPASGSAPGPLTGSELPWICSAEVNDPPSSSPPALYFSLEHGSVSESVAAGTWFQRLTFELIGA